MIKICQLATLKAIREFFFIAMPMETRTWANVPQHQTQLYSSFSFRPQSKLILYHSLNINYDLMIVSHIYKALQFLIHCFLQHLSKVYGAQKYPRKVYHSLQVKSIIKIMLGIFPKTIYREPDTAEQGCDKMYKGTKSGLSLMNVNVEMCKKTLMVD